MQLARLSQRVTPTRPLFCVTVTVKGRGFFFIY
jgi:hypothetical protein